MTDQFVVDQGELAALDTRAAAEVDRATDEAERSPPPEPQVALRGVYAEPPGTRVLWYREGLRSAVDRHERPQGWGTYDAK